MKMYGLALLMALALSPSSCEKVTKKELNKPTTHSINVNTHVTTKDDKPVQVTAIVQVRDSRDEHDSVQYFADNLTPQVYKAVRAAATRRATSRDVAHEAALVENEVKTDLAAEVHNRNLDVEIVAVTIRTSTR